MQAVLSLCDGNTMGPHMVGDLVCVLLAAAQAPWLCSAPCSLELVASSAAWLAARVSSQHMHKPWHTPSACALTRAQSGAEHRCTWIACQHILRRPEVSSQSCMP